MPKPEAQKLQRFEAWKRRNDYSWAFIARECGVARNTPRRWAMAKTDPAHCRPEHEPAARLERLSGGEITPASHDDMVEVAFLTVEAAA